jgi:hypothetical protein
VRDHSHAAHQIGYAAPPKVATLGGMKLAPAAAVLFASGLAAASPPSLTAVVPDGAIAAVLLHGSITGTTGQLFWSEESVKDLSVYCTRRLGVDLTRVDGIALWSTALGAQASFALYLHLPDKSAPPIKGTVAGSFEGTSLYSYDSLVAAALPGGVLVGHLDEVRAALSVAHGHAPAIGPKSPLATLLTDERGSDFAAALAISALPNPQLQGLSAQFGARQATVILRNGLFLLQVSGDGAKLKTAQALLESTMQTALGELKQKHDLALADDKGDFTAGLTAIGTYDQVNHLWKLLAPKLEGDKLVSRYQLPDLKSAQLMLPLLGVATAIAIPSYEKYVRRSKTVEATMNVRKLADAAASWANERAPGQKRAFKFPKSTDWTPAGSCCPDTCAANAALWTQPTFRQLGFSVDEPFRYQYRVLSEGRGAGATIKVQARGDLDCDGVWSLYERTVTVDAKGSASVGTLFSQHEIE